MIELKHDGKIEYPVRINRYLALNNVCSRREADALVTRGAVFINGKKAKLGDKVLEEDDVKINIKHKIKEYVYFAYNKPKGKEISYSNEEAKGAFPVGSLDKESHGLVILTNDGRIAGRLLDLERAYEREYVVSVNKPMTNIFLKIMKQGVELEDFKTKPSLVEKKNDRVFKIIITEERKHEIRRMCANLGWDVTDLERTRIENIFLGNLAARNLRQIEGEELDTFLGKLA